MKSWPFSKPSNLAFKGPFEGMNELSTHNQSKSTSWGFHRTMWTDIQGTEPASLTMKIT